MVDNASRKKDPTAVKMRLLDAAADIALAQGLDALSLQSVALAAGVTKGGLFHHFPSRRALIDALFDDLLTRYDMFINSLMADDPDTRGAFSRAYVRSVATKAPDPGGERLIGAFSLVISLDEEFADRWQDWMHRRLDTSAEDPDNITGIIVRHAVDGFWLARAIGFTGMNEAVKTAALDHLIEMTHQIEGKRK